MKIEPLHAWVDSVAEAKLLQCVLAKRVDTRSRIQPWRTLAAADVSYLRGDSHLFAAVVVVEAGSMHVLEQAVVNRAVGFPYVPGYLSFREIPPLIAAFEQLKAMPDVVLCDGQGIAHPRRLGLASHLGLWLNRPTIGCAKSWLLGTFEPLGVKRGARSPLVDQGETLGAVLRTRARVKPLYVSPGHLCTIDDAVEVVMSTLGTWRLPVPARLAHRLVNDARTSGFGV